MSKYIEQLLEEKKISVETGIDLEGHIGLTLQNVVEFIDNMPKAMQDKVRATLVEIDYKNGDVMHFFHYIAKGMVTLV